DLFVCRDDGLPAEFRFDPVAQRGRRVDLAVDDERCPGRTSESRQPAHQLGRIGVGRQAPNALYVRANRYPVAVNLDLPFTILQAAPPRSRGLIANEDDRAAWVGQVPGQVVQDAAAGGHSGSRNDDCRAWFFVERFGSSAPLYQ